VQGAVGYYDRSQDQLLQDAFTGQLSVDTFSERFATLSATFVGDTTRFQSFGPFQGKRFSVGVLYGANAGGDLDGDLLEYQLDFRAYKQLTRRSLIAWRLAGVYGAGDLQNYYSLGGINQLRGYDFREFFGSRVVYNNLELRFPLIDELQTPILGFRDIRGFLFFDVGAAWFPNNQFFDPAGCSGPLAGQALCGFRSGFKFWDSENNRLQDARGSYGFGLQFFFLGGLQFNWAWAKRMDYTQYLFDPNVGDFVPTKAHNGGYDVNFYIVFDY
jgi:outer membrane protein assembly factor BamA